MTSLQLAELLSAHFTVRKREENTTIHRAKIRQVRGEDLKDYMMTFNPKVVLIMVLQDVVAYMTFLNGLLPGRFKFSPVESKMTTLAEALRRTQDFTGYGDICWG